MYRIYEYTSKNVTRTLSVHMTYIDAVKARKEKQIIQLIRK